MTKYSNPDNETFLIDGLPVTEKEFNDRIRKEMDGWVLEEAQKKH